MELSWNSQSTADLDKYFMPELFKEFVFFIGTETKNM